MFPIPDPMSMAAKAGMEANLALYTALTSKTLESVEKLINLNISAVKSSLEDSSSQAKQLLSARDPEEFLSVVREQTKPGMSKAVAYGGNLFSIAQGIQSELSHTAEAQMSTVNRKVNELVEQAASNAPVGSEALVAMVRSTLGNAGNGYEQLARTAKQTMDAFEATFNSTFGQFVQAAAPKQA
ncbi:hypothetical protein GCM10027343_38090 [Noviherbaspirillum agri]